MKISGDDGFESVQLSIRCSPFEGEGSSIWCKLAPFSSIIHLFLYNSHIISLKTPKTYFPQIREQTSFQPLWRLLEWSLLSSSWWFCGGDSEPAITLWRDSGSFYSFLMQRLNLQTSDSLGRRYTHKCLWDCFEILPERWMWWWYEG